MKIRIRMKKTNQNKYSSCSRYLTFKLTDRRLTLAEKNTAKPKVRQTNPGEPETRQGGGTTAGVEHKNFIQALPCTNQCTNRDLLPDQGPRRHTRYWRANEQRNSYLAFFLTALKILYRCWPIRSPVPCPSQEAIRSASRARC